MTIPPRHIRKAALAALACALFLIFPASPAFAHDTLKSSSPAKNAQISSPKEIELEFSAGVKFPFVVLHDAAGKEIALGEPRLDGPLVRTDVPQTLPPGSYVLAWRVVSSDGHPIEGEIPFGVRGSSSTASPSGEQSAPADGQSAGPATGPATDAATDTATSAAATSAAPAGPDASAAAGQGPASSAGVPGWIWGGLAVLVVLGAFVLLRTSRRGRDREEVDAG
ncbi:copper resistance protein CopC [Nonomuraea fuscirosea]|jgi:copper resistance protein C|uniref:copper resistance CopC family protein n=1 Tax=Nonomuraea fuscirosea TaxID=1291556 RepID=UPI00341E1963